MALLPRLPMMLRGVPARFAAVILVGSAFAGWAVGPSIWTATPASTPSVAFAGKHADRLAFSGDESEIPVREARIFDTIAMFAQPQTEARPWSQAPVAATALEAGIKPLRPAAPTRLAEAPRKAAEPAAKPQRLAMTEPARPVAKRTEAPEGVRLLGWEVPGSRHLPTRRDASQALDKIGSGANAVGTGTVKAVSRTASLLGDGVSRAGTAIAGTLGLD